MIKKLIYTMSAIALSFPAEGMEQHKIFPNFKTVKDSCDQAIKAQTSDIEEASARAQVCMLKQTHGSSIDPKTGREIIDLSCQNCYESHVRPLLYKCTDREKESDEYRKILALMSENKNLQGEVFSHESFADLCCEELFDLSSLSEDLSARFHEMISYLALWESGQEKLKYLQCMVWLSEISNGSVENKKIFIQNKRYIGCAIGSFPVIAIDLETEYHKEYFLVGYSAKKAKSIDCQFLRQLSVDFLHRLSNICNMKFLYIPANIFAASALNDKTLRPYMFPAHDKQIFDAVCRIFAKILIQAKINVAKNKDKVGRVIDTLSRYREQMKSYTIVDGKHIPIGHLLSDGDIGRDSTGLIAAQIMVAAFLSCNSISIEHRIKQSTYSENLWLNSVDMLAIYGAMPIDIDGHRYMIVDRQSENVLRSDFSNPYRIFNRCALFDVNHVSDVLCDMGIMGLLKQGTFLQRIIEISGGKSSNPSRVFTKYLSGLFVQQIMRLQSPYILDTECKYQPIEITNVLQVGPFVDLNILDLPIIPQVFLRFVYENWKGSKFATTGEGRTFLYLAVKAGMPFAFIEQMLRSIPEKNRLEYIQEADISGNFTMLMACLCGCLSTFDMLRDSILEFQLPSLLFNTVSGIATENMQKIMIKKICGINFDFGVTSNQLIFNGAKNEASETLLHIAAKNDNAEVIANLLEHQLKPDVLDKTGRTPIMSACSEMSINAMQSLKAGGAKIDCVDSDGNTLAHIAVKTGDPKVLEYVLETLKVNPNTPNKNMYTPIMSACSEMSINAMQILKASGAKINCVDRDRNTLAHIAVNTGNVNVVKYVFETLKVNPNTADANRFTPIMCACLSGSIEIVKILRTLYNADIKCVMDILVNINTYGYDVLAAYVVEEIRSSMGSSKLVVGRK